MDPYIKSNKSIASGLIDNFEFCKLSFTYKLKINLP